MPVIEHHTTTGGLSPLANVANAPALCEDGLTGFGRQGRAPLEVV
jgi:hypothetical protein